MALRRLPVRVRPVPPITNTLSSSVSNADEDYIRTYNGPKVAIVGRPT